MAYLAVDWNKVKGFSKLSEHGKEILKRIYKKHNAIHGIEHKSEWMPVEVVPGHNCLKVTFTNGEWLHYYANDTWG